MSEVDQMRVKHRPSSAGSPGIWLLCSACFGVCVCVYFVFACVVDATSALIHCGIPSCVQSTSYPVSHLLFLVRTFCWFDLLLLHCSFS